MIRSDQSWRSMLKPNLESMFCIIPALMFGEPSCHPLTRYESFYEAFAKPVEKGPEAFICYSDVPDPLFNVIMRLSCVDVREKVDSILEKAPRNQPISFWLHPQNHAPGLKPILQEKGFSPLIRCPLFTWTVKEIEVMEGDIRRADMFVFHEIVGRVYSFTEEVKTAFEKLMEKIECENYLIYEQGIPIGTATLLVKGSVGGIFNDATLPGQREASKALTEFLMCRAFELRLDELVLLSSPEGEELYADLGFNKVFDIEIYGRPHGLDWR